MFLAAAKAVPYAGLDHIIYICSFTGGICGLLLMWFTRGLPRWQQRIIPGGNVTAIAVLALIVAISAVLLH